MVLNVLTTSLVFISALAGTVAVRAMVTRAGWLDVPNPRSSHDTPTPRGGGLAIACAFFAGLTLLFIMGSAPPNLCIALIGGGVVVSAIGLLDDIRSQPAWLRLLFHFAAAAWALAWLGSPPPLQFFGFTWHWGPVGPLVASVALVWLINLFNFMDGIDGIAAMETVFVAAGLLAVGGWQGSGNWMTALLAASSAGFLVFNWPPAKIFMGDVGSGFLGFALGVVALHFANAESVGIWGFAILAGAFIVDATVTLIVRLLHRERVSQAHRNHVYQKLSRRWGSHLVATLAYLAVNVVVLLPAALAASAWPALSAAIAASIYIMLALLAVLLGAGRKDEIDLKEG